MTDTDVGATTPDASLTPSPDTGSDRATAGSADPVAQDPDPSTPNTATAVPDTPPPSPPPPPLLIGRPQKRNPNAGAALVFLPIFLGGVTLIAGPQIHSEWARPIMFGLICALTAFEFMALGFVIRGRASGVLIDARNCMSLSRLQMCGWTVLVLSAVFVVAAYNVSSGVDKPLNIVIPYELLIAMGISATSLVAAPAVLSVKASQDPSQGDLDNAAGKLNIADTADIPNNGKVMGNISSNDASYIDLFTGDDVSNFDSPDIGKIQQILITLLLLSVYGAAVVSSFIGGGARYSLPTIDNGFIWLLGVSNVSYLAYKAAPHPSAN